MNRTAALKKLSRRIRELSDRDLEKLLQIVDNLTKDDLKCLKYFGLWKDRKDFNDSLAWVRRLRDEERYR